MAFLMDTLVIEQLGPKPKTISWRNCLALNGRPISKTSTSTYPGGGGLNPATGRPN